MLLKSRAELTPLDAFQAGLALLLMYWGARYALGTDPLAVASAVLLGLLLLASAFARLGRDPSLHDRAVLGIGLAALLAPPLLGFGDVTGAAGMHVKAGIAVVTMALLRMAVRDFSGGRPA
jgi:hypothetical protein